MLNYFSAYNRLERKRKKLLSQLTDKLRDSALSQYIHTPFKSFEQEILDLDLLSIDFETTGLNAVSDKLLSMGRVEMHKGRIQLASASHNIINVKQPLNSENVVIHQITDSETNRGCALKKALDELLTAMTGKVLLVHYAHIERSFLEQACWQVYGVKPPFLMIDTLAIIKKRFDMSDAGYDPSRLRLANLLAEYQLPTYSSHNALYDAISTAELLLAELHHHKQGLKTKLKDLV
ncbi:MAG: DNA polymerase III subunit epsilon [Gammaproteobacteria bacterium]|nr:DNA polymerase III subunit epsilon [Gammaproteobacteria bacterium]